MERLIIKTEPRDIFSEYEQGNSYKSSIGDNGLFEQTKMNERFFVGDHWYGAQCGNKRPLIRRNIVKRIGDYKISSIGAAPVAVNYSADGIPNTADLKDEKAQIREQMLQGEMPTESFPPPAEVAVITDALNQYFKTTAERLKFDSQKEIILRNAYISGTGIGYTYWDDSIDTGLYADEGRTTKIKGDIVHEIIDVENVVFGDPNDSRVQTQPFIIIAQRRYLDDVRREARLNKQNDAAIKADGSSEYNSGVRGENEPADTKRVTVITKLYKEYSVDDKGYTVKAVRVTKNAVVRPPWDLGLTRYPIAVMFWESRNSSAYGDSEITYLIPNQIAINRMLTAQCWSALSVGMPKVIVNGDIVDTEITNDPGQIIKVYGNSEDVVSAIRYVSPPYFANQYINAINDLASNTLGDSGANDAALGNVKPNNAAAIIQMREAALQPMQLKQNAYYAFVEDTARIWADFWVNKYGNRSLKVDTENGTEYIPFEADRYKSLVLTAKVDVGASTLWSEAIVISTLDALRQAQIIDDIQYLERLPKGLIHNLTGLIEAKKGQIQAAAQQQSNKQGVLQEFMSQYPEQYEQYLQLPPEEQELLLQKHSGGDSNEMQ